MRSRRRWRTTIYLVTAVLTGILAIGTLIVHDWAEILFGVEPDDGSGAFEVGVTVVIALISIGLLVLTLADLPAGRRQTQTAGDSDVV
jgi:hypothetical protein